MDFEIRVLMVSLVGAAIATFGYLVASDTRFKKNDYKNKILYSRRILVIKVGFVLLEVIEIFRGQLNSKTILPQVLVLGFVLSVFKAIDDYYDDIQKYEQIKEKQKTNDSDREVV